MTRAADGTGSRRSKSGDAAAAAHTGEARPYRLEDQVGFKLRKAHQRASEIFADVMGSLDVTPTQLAALVKLDEMGPTSQNLLGRRIAVDPATIFGVVGRLMRRGLVAQRLDASDARLTVVELTEEGRTLVARIRAIGHQVSDRTLAPLSVAEARMLLDLLDRLG